MEATAAYSQPDRSWLIVCSNVDAETLLRCCKQVQQLGRTHRSNQVQPPKYLIVSSDISGEQRFASAVAKRLEQLGALTHGDRHASSASDALSSSNLQTRWDWDPSLLLLNSFALILDPTRELKLNISLDLPSIRVPSLCWTGNMSRAPSMIRPCLSYLTHAADTLPCPTCSRPCDAASREAQVEIEARLR